MRRWAIFPASVFFLFISAFILTPERALFRLSPQATVDPSAVTGEYEPEALAMVDNRRIVVPDSEIAYAPPVDQAVLGESTSGKRIEVDLTNQRLYAYDGDQKVYDFLVSTGKWGRTPTGTFWIWTKLRYTRMQGGSKALGTYYNLPNVPYTMFFYNDKVPKWRGYGIHGTYWHSNFGHPMSHGCINMKTEEVALIYAWALPDLRGKASINVTSDNPGTPVIIYGTAPQT